MAISSQGSTLRARVAYQTLPRSPVARFPKCALSSYLSQKLGTQKKNASSRLRVVAAAAKQAVVVGGGWAGLGAASSLCDAGFEVVLLDASDNTGGLSTAFKTTKGKVVEPGIKGFWYPYRNIDALVESLSIERPFTPYTRSSFWTPSGLQVTAPIFQELPQLPTPLGSFLHTAPYFTSLPIADRLSALPLITALLQHDLDDRAYLHYDSMSAYDLFVSHGVSRRLYKEFLEPMLLVTLFAPPEKLSAAAALGTLYYFVLAHQSDFDVRWCRGPIGERIFLPWERQLRRRGVAMLGGRYVQQLEEGSKAGSSRVVARDKEGVSEAWEADVVVLAVGVNAMKRVVASSPLLGALPEFRALANLSAIDVLATRLWLDRKVEVATASNAVSGFDEGVGGTFFDLGALQDEYRGEAGSVVEVDLYHAGTLLPMGDEAVVRRMMDGYLGACIPEYRDAKVLDYSVLRFRNAVTAFSPGSHLSLPPTRSSRRGVYVAGDCIRQGPGTHGAKGLSQEKAYVSGLLAGNAAAEDCGLSSRAAVIAAQADEPHVAAAKQLARVQMEAARKVPFLSRLLASP